jgi:hypothetical protein
LIHTRALPDENEVVFRRENKFMTKHESFFGNKKLPRFAKKKSNNNKQLPGECE